MSVTAMDLQAAFHYETANAFHVLIPNVFFGNASNEMDLLGIRRNNYCEEIEIKIKISVSDFKADFKKKCQAWLGEYQTWGNKSHHHKKYQDYKKHDALKEGRLVCNRFNFLLPSSIVDKCDIPEYAGLYIYQEDETKRPRIIKKKQGRLLHKNKLTDADYVEAARKMNYKYWDTEHRRLIK